MIQPNRKRQIGALLDADLYKQARLRALAEDRPVGELIDDALRAYLDLESEPSVPKRTKAPVIARSKS